MGKILYEGKSKIICEGNDDKSLIIRYKDSVTAFDGKKKDELSGKGGLNAEISRRIYAYLARNGIETHLIERLDDTADLVRKAEIIMVEVIVRNIAAGGFTKKYGVAEGTPLEPPTVEFSLKSDEFGDPMINESQIVAIGKATREELAFMAAQSLEINRLLRELFGKAGITLVDFKLEFGRYDGRIILCDEISPDSCRLWDKDSGEKFDKDLFRRDLGDLVVGYGEVLSRLDKLC